MVLSSNLTLNQNVQGQVKRCQSYNHLMHLIWMGQIYRHSKCIKTLFDDLIYHHQRLKPVFPDNVGLGLPSNFTSPSDSVLCDP